MRSALAVAFVLVANVAYANPPAAGEPPAAAPAFEPAVDSPNRCFHQINNAVNERCSGNDAWSTYEGMSNQHNYKYSVTTRSNGQRHFAVADQDCNVVDVKCNDRNHGGGGGGGGGYRYEYGRCPNPGKCLEAAREVARRKHAGWGARIRYDRCSRNNNYVYMVDVRGDWSYDEKQVVMRPNCSVGAVE